MNRLVLAATFCAASALVAPHLADAAPCESLPGTKVYLQVGDTQLNLMKRLGRALRNSTTKPLTLVFTTSGSCDNITAIYTRVAFASGKTLQYIPSTTEDGAWTPTSATLTCEAPLTADGLKVPDIANSALFNSACASNGSGPPATVNLIEGPAQAYVMATPIASAQEAITYEEAYFVFGFGTAGMVSPWVNESQMFIRTVTKSTLLAWAANIGVPAAKWHGVMRDGSPMVVADLTTSTTVDQAIGILGAEVYDGLRDKLKSLAFRAKGQYAAYFADSTSTSRDKKNVRDGHYTVWSPTIWMDTVAAGVPVNADARYINELIAGRVVTPDPGFSMIDLIAAVGLVPDCAMGVSREFEGGPLKIYKPATSCVCKYESLVDTSSCATCTVGGAACASGTCRNGFCEVQ